MSDTQIKQLVNILFQKYDYDHSGTLEVNELTDILKDSHGGKKMSQYEIDAFLKGVDTNGDGKISKEELFQVFKRLMR